jgi:hypothetical protein
MPYRDAGIVEFCSVCVVATRSGCRRCQRPCCEAHVSRRRYCVPCELERGERSSARVALGGYLAVGVAACALVVVALIGSGMSVAVAVAGIVAVVVATGLVERQRALVSGPRQKLLATPPRP